LEKGRRSGVAIVIFMHTGGYHKSIHTYMTSVSHFYHKKNTSEPIPNHPMLVTLKFRIGSQPNPCPGSKQFYFNKYEESKAANKRRRR
jgi:hypothetical protein